MTDILQEVKRRRTFAIISHPDAGKTTLTEKLLLFTGVIKTAGSVKARKSSKHASSDWMEIEKQRGISVTASVIQIEYRNCMLNLLDTPGHQDFSEDTYRVLTIVDSALMVIDAAKGIEPQTMKLLQICRSRNIPIITFVNKVDREVREPLELISEIEKYLLMDAVPFSWPIGTGKSFSGVFDIRKDQISAFRSNKEHPINRTDAIRNLHNSDVKRVPDPIFEQTNGDILLIKGATPIFDPKKFSSGQQTPVFFGSAINNFGIQELLDALVEHAPKPGPCQTLQREVRPDEANFTGVVFKVQANMDPAHHDRVAFIKVNSGRFQRGMRLKISRNNKQIKLNNITCFLSQRRELINEAYAGDIIGMPNHGVLQLGDVLTEGENLQFIGLPFFAPELFHTVKIKDPTRTKQLHNGLTQLGEEGAIQVFRLANNGALMLGAIGTLQFEVVAHRLKTEYRAEISVLPSRYKTARWISSNNPDNLREFIENNAAHIAYDVANAATFLISSPAQLRTAKELYPEVRFHSMREYGSCTFMTGS